MLNSNGLCRIKRTLHKEQCDASLPLILYLKEYATVLTRKVIRPHFTNIPKLTLGTAEVRDPRPSEHFSQGL